MRFALIGGDRRAALLAELLLRDGHRVHSYALEKAALPAEIPRDGSPQICSYGADCVILPAPAETGGLLNAPLSAQRPGMTELLGAFWPGQLVCGGRLSAASVEAALRGGLRVEDVLRRPAFAAGNAAITAEGAVGLLLRESERTLLSSRCLLLGWGKIGQQLAPRLAALGAELTVAARAAKDRAMAEGLGHRSADYGALEAMIGEFDFVISTVPARVLSDAALCCMQPESLLLELASPPGSFDPLLAQNIGLRVLRAPGLPGKSAPLSAAALLRRTLYEILAEQED